MKLRILARVIRISGLAAGAAFAISFPIACIAVSYEAGRQYPHDGQNGLFGFLIGGLVGFVFAILTFLVTVIWQIMRLAALDES